METKDYILGGGILVTFLIGVFNFSLALKNRRNTLREHLYKEQINFFSKFLVGVNKLNFEIEGLINNPSRRSDNNFYELIQLMSYDYYNSEFIIPAEISGLIHNHIFKGNQFYSVCLTTNENKIAAAYSNYFESYTGMLNRIKEFIGTNELSTENKKLHSQNEVSKSSILKLILDISQRVS